MCLRCKGEPNFDAIVLCTRIHLISMHRTAVSGQARDQPARAGRGRRVGVDKANKGCHDIVNAQEQSTSLMYPTNMTDPSGFNFISRQ